MNKIKNDFSFNEDFCSHLEYALTKALKISNQPDLNGFWCDGVLHISIDNSQSVKKNLQKTGKIITNAWLGKDGQSQYEMIIHFGDNSLKKILNGLEIISCIPDINSTDWFKINPASRQVEIKLL